jgi:cytochrome c oxidase subunit 1
MPRRIYTYDKSLHLGLWNMVATVGAFVIALSVLVFIYNAVVVTPKSAPAPADPWDARTLEWSVPAPVPEYNFATIPTVHSLDDWWHRKYTEDEDGRLIKLESYDAVVATAADDGLVGKGHNHGVHMPSPSYFPLISALGPFIIAYGMILGRSNGANYLVCFVGLAVLLLGLYGWGLEPSTEPEEHHPEGPSELEAAEQQPALVGAPGTAELEAGSEAGGPAEAAGSAGATAGGEAPSDGGDGQDGGAQ